MEKELGKAWGWWEGGRGGQRAVEKGSWSRIQPLNLICLRVVPGVAWLPSMEKELGKAWGWWEGGRGGQQAVERGSWSRIQPLNLICLLQKRMLQNFIGSHTLGWLFPGK